VRYVQINAYSGGWADSIIFEKHRELQSQGYESYVFWARGRHEQDEYMQRIASYPEICLDALQTRIDGRASFHSKGITKRLLKKLDVIDPDVVHLHLLLGYYINVEMLFDWLMNHHCKVIWTLHDCWAFTGHCIYFTHVKCNQWKTSCGASAQCPQIRSYPETFCKSSVQWNYANKKRLFTMLPPDRVELITPSYWLANLVKESYLKKYDVKVVHNTINTRVFKPSPSDFRTRYSIGDRFLILGVASKWSERKGLSDFVSLANNLDPDLFCVATIGLSRKQIRRIKGNLLALPRTGSMKELAEAYTAADILFNPSEEETFGMNVAEADACGTRSIVIEGSACAEVMHNAIAISPDLSTLTSTIKKLSKGEL
jgi:glycosyltransferase involved in cell wall biosynthesis